MDQLESPVQHKRKFQYTPLDNPNDFRVISLLPGEFEEPIVCELQTISRTAGKSLIHSFEALSYVWGDPKDKIRIECGSAWLEIPNNLCSALRQLRWPDRQRTLWADSICINQDDANEKNEQVRRMNAIFADAEQVIMWQGEETEDTRDALTSLAQLCDLAMAERDSEEWQAFLAQAERAISSPSLSRRDPVLLAVKKPNWASLAALFSRPYFQRRWITQEVLLSTKATMVCGKQTLDWSLIVKSAPMLQEVLTKTAYILSNVTPNKSTIVQFVVIADHHWRARQAAGSHADIVGLHHALLGFSKMECFDPRDKLFALVHIAHDVDLAFDAELVPDYTIDEGEMLHRLAIWSIVRKGHIIYLSHAGLDGHAKEDTERRLPSWVPLNLSYMLSRGSLQWHITQLKQDRQPMYSNTSCLKQPVKLSENRRVMTMPGRILDQVEITSRPLWKELWTRGTPGNQVLSAYVHKERVLERYGMRGLDDLRMVFLLQTCVSIYAGTESTWQDTVCSKRFIHYLLDTLVNFQEITKLPRMEREQLILQYMRYLCAYSLRIFTGVGEVEKRNPDFQVVFDDLAHILYWDTSSGNQGQRLCKTQKGMIGWTAAGVREGDIVCALYGTEVPWAIRSTGNDDYWLIGECCLEGFLHGEAFELPDVVDQPISLC